MFHSIEYESERCINSVVMINNENMILSLMMGMVKKKASLSDVHIDDHLWMVICGLLI